MMHMIRYMSSTSVYIRTCDYLVYDIGYHHRLFDKDEDMFAEIDGETLPEILEYYANMECIAIYDFGMPIFEDLDSHPDMKDFIGNNKLFSGVVMVSIEGDKIDYSQIASARDGMKAIGHCACIGSIYAIRYDQNERISVITVHDDTESG